MGHFGTYNSRLFKVAIRKKLWLCPLGKVEEFPIWLVRTNMIYDKKRPHILIAAGFHGEEKAGPLAIMRWLESKQIPKNIDISFLPVINPVGFNIGQRYNNKGQPSNGGFCHPEIGDAPSEEGQILIANETNLKKLARDGYLDLHEDVTQDEYYVYTYEKGRTEPCEFTKKIRDVEDRFFSRYGDGNGVVTDGTKVVLYGQTEPATVKDGIVFNLCDGSYEDLRMHTGSAHSLATETPAKGVRISKRINANTAIMDKFIELTIEEFYGTKRKNNRTNGVQKEVIHAQ
jgi:hypothetical protein